MKAILGTKVGMTHVFAKDGRSIPVTIIHIEPNQVLEVRTKEKDGYDAIQVGYMSISDKNVTKARKGHFEKNQSDSKRFIREFRDVIGYKTGDLIKADLFTNGDIVDAQAFSKGHGFTGSIKRHNFGIGPMGHGAGYPHRYVGSISGGRGGSQAQRVFKGQKMPGHYGHEKTTVHNLTIVDVQLEKNLILIKGAVPGPNKSLVKLRQTTRHLNKKNVIELVNLNSNTKIEPSVEISENKG
jgi:large subunit ribosomal protein L3